MRKASINFKPVNDIKFALAHALRTQKHPPTYLLPPEYRLGNCRLFSMKADELIDFFEKRKSTMTGQARSKGSSPFWEGVLVLPGINEETNVDKYLDAVEGKLNRFFNVFEKLTGMRVLESHIHLDEGYKDESGRAVYNPHAHIFVDRLNAQGRLIRLGRSDLSKVQDLAAEAMEMQRGETLAQRDGRRGRKHVDHQDWKQAAEAKRLLEQAKPGRSDCAELEEKFQISLREGYREARGVLKGCGQARQAHYQTLKRLFDNQDARAVTLSDYVVIDQVDFKSVIVLLDDWEYELRHQPFQRPWEQEDTGTQNQYLPTNDHSGRFGP